MAETTLKIAREIADSYSPKGGFIDRGELARLIHEKLTPLVEALELYRASHNFCVEGERQGRCNKCRIADRELARIKGGGQCEV